MEETMVKNSEKLPKGTLKGFFFIFFSGIIKKEEVLPGILVVNT